MTNLAHKSVFVHGALVRGRSAIMINGVINFVFVKVNRKDLHLSSIQQ